ncbi:thiamine biosynthesis protein ApbE [Lactobacillus sp. CBA3605]|uniref:FAD:protein FMN transferase n=1 Tax=Lactobacillus sp. CBA3605 TaxID=2099788 RepID=UPI000CFBF6E9|nr:FAD:protein FMN transferase [Lactobacillus sp. CBA3605]AVK60894.1 thiamine biosynthesis protein ApbE [Lactobacillus sp. CBA3605]
MQTGTRTLHLMGTVITIWVAHPQPASLLADAERRLIDYEQRFSANDEQSQLSRLNQQAGLKPMTVDADLFELIQIGTAQSLVPGTALNIAIGPLIKAWRIGFDDAHYPTPAKLKTVLKLIDPHEISLDASKQTVLLKKVGMQLDLGALAKGYFADKIIALFKAQGATAAFINLGGNVLTYGKPPQRAVDYWRVGIQNPFLARGNDAAAVQIKDKSVVTSGIYERQLTWHGQTYHHIFDDQTGYPIKTDLESLTIVSAQSLAGEIWTTRLFNQTPRAIITQLNQVPGIEGLVITKQGELAYTTQLADRIKIAGQ